MRTVKGEPATISCMSAEAASLSGLLEVWHQLQLL